VKTSNLSLVPLRQATLCLDCENITTAHANCHACGSRALLNVARALNHQRPFDLACSGRTAAVPISVPRVRQREPFHLRRGPEKALPRRFDFSTSESSA
jgi:hypothetical protein